MSINKTSTIIIISRVFTLLAGLLVVALVVPSLSKIEQGYFFVFTSIAASQVLFELGLSGLIVHHFSREHAKLLIKTEGAGKITEAINAVAVKNYCRKYFMVSSAMYSIIIGTGGAVFLNSSPQGGEVSWIYPWIIITIGTALNLFNFNYHAYLNGFSEVTSSYAIRIKANILMIGLLSTMVVVGAGLLAYPISMMVSNLYATLLLRTACKKLDQTYIHVSGGSSQEIKMGRNQVRMALSAASGYVVANSLTPYALHFYGAEYAGRIGLGLAIFSAISTLSVARTTAEAPKYGHVIEKNDLPLLHTMWKKTALITLVFALTLCIIAIGLIFLMENYFPSVSHRFLKVEDLVILGLFSISGVTLASISTVLRAFKEELLMLPSLAAAAIMIVSQLWLKLDPMLCVIILLVYNISFFLPHSMHLFRKKLKRKYE